MSDNNSPNNNVDTSRRKFIKNTGLVVGGVAGGSLLGGLLVNQHGTVETSSSNKSSSEETSSPTRARMFFTRFEDFVVLEQATERIYPKDDNGPGAIELDVPYFIDKQLAGQWGMNVDDYRQGPFSKTDTLAPENQADYARETRGKVFLEGLRKLNSESNKRFDKTFDEASEEQQIELLQDFENGKVKMRLIPSEGFFSLLHSATLEGAYSDPLYGGNKNMDGWRMKEFPGPVMSYKDDIDKNEFVKKEPISLKDYQQS